MFARHKKHSLKFAVLVLLTINLTAWSSATAYDECTVDLYYDLYQAVVDIRLLTPCERRPTFHLMTPMTSRSRL
jgi:hypothetical protein